MTTSSSRPALAAAIGLLLALRAASAAAQPEPSAPEAARVLYVEGKDLRRAGDLSLSLEKLEAAHALYATPITTLECARAHALVGHFRRAIALLESIADLPPKPSESTKAGDARAEATELAAQYRTRLGTLRFGSISSSAQIVVDNEEVLAAARDGFRVDPGAHHVTVDDHGARTVLDVAVDEGLSRDLALPVPPPAPAPAPVLVSVPAPPQPALPSASAPTSHRAWAYAGFGVGAAGLATGAVTGVMTLTRASALKNECPGGSCLPSAHLSTTQTLGTVSTVAFAVGGAGLLVGVGALVLGGRDRDRDPSKTASVRPVVGLGHVGLVGGF
jgi:hypothetical protein